MKAQKVNVDRQTLRDLLDNVELMTIGMNLKHVERQVEKLRREAGYTESVNIVPFPMTKQ